VIPLVVGCPVAHRSWVLNHWFDAVEASCDAAMLEPRYVFVVDRGDPCVDIIAARAPTAVCSLVSRAKGTDQRIWNPERFNTMVTLRNGLLDLVRSLAPAKFLSVDSDILIHRDLVKQLAEDLDAGPFDGIGGKCYMAESGTKFPSWGRLSPSGGLQRFNAGGYFPVEVIMAIKLMNSRAYHVDYAFDLQGEDIGWSRACRDQGVKLGWEGRLISKHVSRQPCRLLTS
jgi:hypothetical protein